MNKDEIMNMLKSMKDDPRLKEELLALLIDVLDLRPNRFHPTALINGDPEVGENVYIGAYSEVNAKGSKIIIGNNCDIASYVSINVADSHRLALGTAKDIDRQPITLEENVFVGSHCFIGGGTHISHHSVVGAGTILINGGRIEPYSLIVGNPARIKPGYFKEK
ncbi:MAG: acyltransferase [FCB group bacterium]|nr:acyltransferase [FCB group bacterium]